jgi:sugar-phosphatase
MPKHSITSNDVQHGKPDPEPYIKAAKALGIAPADCVVMEDAPAGIRAGKAAGARVLALRTTASDAELTQSCADWIANDLASLRLNSLGNYDPLTLILDR